MGLFIGNGGVESGFPIPDTNESSFAQEKGPANGTTDLTMDKGGITNPQFTGGLAGAGTDIGETQGSIIKTTVKRWSVDGAPTGGQVEVEKIPGSGVKIPKPGF